MIHREDIFNKLSLTIFFSAVGGVLYVIFYHTISNSNSLNKFMISYSYRDFLYSNQPIIMTWNTFFSNNATEIVERELEGCPYKCHVIDGSERALVRADAIIFHGIDDFDPPRWRWSHQIYALFIQESPLTAKHKIDRLPTSFFNVSFTYHKTSDTNYGVELGKLKPVKRKNYDSIERKIDETLTKKKFGSLSIASNCWSNSGREAYVDELAKYTNVTRRGKCSGVAWDCRDMEGSGCDQQLIESHMFYLSFENSVCEDYITEKFFKVLTRSVPIVLKRSILKNHAPDHMFIAADDFDSPRDLSNFLNDLSQNMTAYRSYFSWMRDYDLDLKSSALCELCTDLHLRPGRNIVIENTQKYYSPLDQCIPHFAKTLMRKK